MSFRGAKRRRISWKRNDIEMKNTYYVYIMTNSGNNVLYAGVTNDIKRRVWEHKNHALGGFTDRYNVTKCVYVAEFGDINDAIAADKRIKGWSRQKKFMLINSINPELKDLFKE